MKKRRCWPAVLSLIAIILELTPWGAVLTFAAPPGAESFRETFSYFNIIMLWGYASFAPVLTAIATCMLFVISLVHIFSGKYKTAIKALSVIAFVFSVISLASGFSIIGAAISVMLAAAAVTAFAVKEHPANA